NRVDSDGDGYAQSARRMWDRDVAGGSGSLKVHEKVYWKLASSGTWNLIVTTSPHVISGTSTADQQFVDFTGGGHNLYDWTIEVYRSGLSSVDYTRGPGNDADFVNVAMETPAEDVVLAATIFDASWTNRVDSDGD